MRFNQDPRKNLCKPNHFMLLSAMPFIRRRVVSTERDAFALFQETSVSSQKFNVGQIVRYTSGFVGRTGADANYKVVRVLPLENDEQFYRIKGDHEAHERVARESQLAGGG
jgi:hypothetical protein